MLISYEIYQGTWCHLLPVTTTHVNSSPHSIMSAYGNRSQRCFIASLVLFQEPTIICTTPRRSIPLVVQVKLPNKFIRSENIGLQHLKGAKQTLTANDDDAVDCSNESCALYAGSNKWKHGLWDVLYVRGQPSERVHRINASRGRRCRLLAELQLLCSHLVWSSSCWPIWKTLPHIAN